MKKEMQNIVNESTTSSNVVVIPAKTRAELTGQYVKKNEKPKIRMAAYARVSTDKEEQMDSFENQVEHYRDLEQKNAADWTLVGIYADPGISAKTTKRPEFQKMIADCEAGKIDRIITKSVSRFARNVVDCIEQTRKLKQQGIYIYFEKECLDTQDPNSDFILTIMASIAEEESRSLSRNVRTTVRNKQKKGIGTFAKRGVYGYKQGPNGEDIIDEETAPIVRKMYQEFLQGYNERDIANHLQQLGYKTLKGKTEWSITTIHRILTSEKMVGDLVLGKTISNDFLEPRRKNRGEAPMYYVPNHHPAIISRQDWDLVQSMMKNRVMPSRFGGGKQFGKYTFSHKIICGNCGSVYRRAMSGPKGDRVPIQGCGSHF